MGYGAIDIFIVEPLSKPTEAFSRATKLSVGSLNQPPHVFWPSDILKLDAEKQLHGLGDARLPTTIIPGIYEVETGHWEQNRIRKRPFRDPKLFDEQFEIELKTEALLARCCILFHRVAIDCGESKPHASFSSLMK